jgi:hypothetical protein
VLPPEDSNLAFLIQSQVSCRWTREQRVADHPRPCLSARTRTWASALPKRVLCLPSSTQPCCQGGIRTPTERRNRAPTYRLIDLAVSFEPTIRSSREGSGHAGRRGLEPRHCGAPPERPMFDDRPSAWVPKRLGFDGVVANIMGGLYEPACSAVIPFFIPAFIRRTFAHGFHLSRRPIDGGAARAPPARPGHAGTS